MKTFAMKHDNHVLCCETLQLQDVKTNQDFEDLRSCTDANIAY